jgi:methylenetetrahydrofolate dehydrogenase (NADP+)/methenyltetrahydrofolate cyclohydrolase
MTKILDGKATAEAIRREVEGRVAAMVEGGARRPGLGVVLVGDDPASHSYVGSKIKACEEVGMVSRREILPGDSPEEAIRGAIDSLNDDDSIDGFLVQLPLPDHVEDREMVGRVLPEKDVDGFHVVNVGRLWRGEGGFAPATPSGIIELLKRYEVPISGARAVIVGRSNIVGKPMAALLLAENATVTVCHSRTRDLPAVCREADILVAAIGRAAFIGPEAVKEGAVVIDVGTNRVADRAAAERLYPNTPERLESFDRRGSILVGDVDFERVKEKASAITPVPGGVGPLTVAMLLVNTLEASRRRQNLPAFS